MTKYHFKSSGKFLYQRYEITELNTTLFKNCAIFTRFCKAINMSGLQDLNVRLWAWLEQVYHRRAHYALQGKSPLERWREDLVHVTLLDKVANLNRKRQRPHHAPTPTLKQMDNAVELAFREYSQLCSIPITNDSTNQEK